MIHSEVPGDYLILVVEGCDGTGKSTLADSLAHEHGFSVIHSPRTPDHVDLAARYREILGRPGPIVLDRAFVSEFVYGPLYRGRVRMSWEEAFDLAELVKARAGAFIHMTGSPQAITERLIERDGTSLPPDELAAIVEAYHRAFETISSYAPVITIEIAETAATIG